MAHFLSISGLYSIQNALGSIVLLNVLLHALADVMQDFFSRDSAVPHGFLLF